MKTIVSRKQFGICLSLLFLAFLHFADWLGSPLAWQDATGWNQLDDSLRPASMPPVDSGGPVIRWLGHAGVYLKWHKTTLLLDPNLSSRCAILRRHMQLPIAAAQLPPIDAVLISHAHFDHLDNPTLESISMLSALITPSGTEDFVSELVKSRTRMIGLQRGENVQIGDLTIFAVEALHHGARYHAFESRYFALGYVISDGKQAIYFAGDTAMGDLFKKIGEQFHPYLALLPIGGFEPRFLLKYHHINPEEAVEAAKLLGVETVIPIHFGTFRVALEEPETALPRFAREAAVQGVHWEMPRLISKDDL